MKRLIMEPQGWPCKLGEYHGGFFIWENDLFFKTEYCSLTDNAIEVFCDSGEYFRPSKPPSPRTPMTNEEIWDLTIQPVEAQWENYDE